MKCNKYATQSSIFKLMAVHSVGHQSLLIIALTNVWCYTFEIEITSQFFRRIYFHTCSKYFANSWTLISNQKLRRFIRMCSVQSSGFFSFLCLQLISSQYCQSLLSLFRERGSERSFSWSVFFSSFSFCSVLMKPCFWICEVQAASHKTIQMFRKG